MKHIIRVIVFASSIALGSLARASIVEVNPGLFSPGTDISNAFVGVTLSAISLSFSQNYGVFPVDGPQPPLDSSPVFAVECTPCISPTDGQMVFGHGSNAANITDSWDWWSENQAAQYLTAAATTDGSYFYHEFGGWITLRADFSSPTNFAQVIGAGKGSGNFFLVDFWGTDGKLLGRCGNDGTTLSASPGISCVETGLTDNHANDPWNMSLTSANDDIAFVTAAGWAGGQYVDSLAFNKPTGVPEPASVALFGAGLFAMHLVRRRRKSASEHR